MICFDSYSGVTWSDVEAVYVPLMKETTIDPKPVPNDVLDSLFQNLSLVNSVLANPLSAKEAQRLLFIAPILFHAVLLFNKIGVHDAKILVD